MLRSMGVLAAMLFSVSAAQGADCLGNVCSYSGTFADDDPIGTTPPMGFILTDIVIGSPGATDIRFLETGTVKVRAYLFNEAGTGVGSVHFTTGIPFSGGSVITAQHNFGLVEITLSGYIPVATGGIPAVGGVGLGILIATLIAAGGWILSRRTGFARAA